LSKDVPRDNELGPAMQALKPKWRAFVCAYLLEPPGMGAQVNAARRAGYGTPKTKPAHMANIAWRLMQEPRIIAAIAEESRKMLRSGSPQAVNALMAMVADPEHKSHARAVEMVLARSDPPEFRQTMTVEHKHNNDDMIELAKRLAQELGVEESTLLGVNRPMKLIEGRAVEVKDPEPAKTPKPGTAE
jgi:phage terminase small subunit